jgi:3-methyladenine DNA glycosylase Tag
LDSSITHKPHEARQLSGVSNSAREAFLVLEAAQAGLSWSIVLKKREGYRRAFRQFDPGKVARYTQTRIRTLTADPSEAALPERVVCPT